MLPPDRNYFNTDIAIMMFIGSIRNVLMPVSTATVKIFDQWLHDRDDNYIIA